jgi:hypothetical protein
MVSHVWRSLDRHVDSSWQTRLVGIENLKGDYTRNTCTCGSFLSQEQYKLRRRTKPNLRLGELESGLGKLGRVLLKPYPKLPRPMASNSTSSGNLSKVCSMKCHPIIGDHWGVGDGLIIAHGLRCDMLLGSGCWRWSMMRKVFRSGSKAFANTVTHNQFWFLWRTYWETSIFIRTYCGSPMNRKTDT